jgi:hypothetical protein
MRFFLHAGLRPSDADVIRRNCINLSLRTNTGLNYLFGLPLEELKLLFATVIEEMKKGGEKRG